LTELIPVSLRSARACIHDQNIPNTTAVRKAKEMTAASTFSLVRNSIMTPPWPDDPALSAMWFPACQDQESLCGRSAGCQAETHDFTREFDD